MGLGKRPISFAVPNHFPSAGLEPKGVPMTTRICRLAVQIAFLYLAFLAGDWLVTRFHAPVPGSVIGMLIVFALLALGLVKETWIQDGAGLLTKHLAFFFIPIAVGLMEWGNLFRELGSWLALALVASTLTAITTVGHLVQQWGRHARRGEDHRWKVSQSPQVPSPSRSSSMP